MVAALHPTETMGDIGYPRTHVYVYKSPNFEPRAARGPECVAIGSGADIEHYRAAIAGITERFEFHKLVEGGLGAQPTALILELHKIVKKVPVNTVSSLFHVGFVADRKVRVLPLDFTEHAGGSSSRIALPPVAPTYEVFQAMCRSRGYADASIFAAEC
jgi:hypothetical protein